MAGRFRQDNHKFQGNTGRIEDTIGWVEKAKDYANELTPAVAYVDLHSSNKFEEAKKSTKLRTTYAKRSSTSAQEIGNIQQAKVAKPS